MSFVEILALFAVALAAWFTWDSLKAREAANVAMRSACVAHGLLFLDDTVAIRSVRPHRGEDGQLRLRRVYGFEFSDTGTNRRRGTVALVGTRIEAVDLGQPPAPVVPFPSPPSRAPGIGEGAGGSDADPR